MIDPNEADQLTNEQVEELIEQVQYQTVNMTVYDIILSLRESLAIINPNTKAAHKAILKL